MGTLRDQDTHTNTHTYVFKLATGQRLNSENFNLRTIETFSAKGELAPTPKT